MLSIRIVLGAFFSLRMRYLGIQSCILYIVLNLGWFSYNKEVIFSVYAQSHSSISESTKIDARQFLRKGIISYRGANFKQAIVEWKQALHIYQRLEDHSKESIILGNLGIAHEAIGEYSQSIAYHHEALFIAKKWNNLRQLEKINGNLGNTYAAIGNYEQALFHQNRALVLAKENGNLKGQGISLGNLGAIYSDMGETNLSLQKYQDSLAITQKSNNIRSEGYTLTNIGSLYHRQKEYDKAAKSYEKSFNIAQKVNDQWLKAESLASLGLVYEGLNEYQKSLTYYDQGLEIFETIGARQETATTLNNRAHTLLVCGKFAQAEQDLQRAITLLDELRIDLDNTSQVLLFDTQVLTYNLLQQVLIAQNRPEVALEISEHGRARAFVNLISQRYQTSQSVQSSTSPPSIEKIRQISQAQNATLVEYSIVPEDNIIHHGKKRGVGSTLYIWVIQPTGQVTFRKQDLKSLTTPLSNLISRSRQAMGVKGRGVKVAPRIKGPQNQTQNLQKLYELVITPIEDLLPEDPKERIIFIAQDSLFLLPFPALLDQKGKYLIDKHTISTAPSIQVLDLTYQQRIKSNQKRERVSLVVGNPTMPKIPLQIGKPPEQLSPLPGAEIEAHSIASLLNTKALTGSQATKEAVMSRLPQANVIHLATHGLLEDFKKTGIPGAIALAPTEKNDGLLSASELLNINLNTDLVVLSACDTGRGNVTGDGVVGLSRSLVAAGAPSIIVSLWSIPDGPTATLMTKFYEYYQQDSFDKAQALREAMLETKNNHPNPRDWAAFTLIGEAQ